MDWRDAFLRQARSENQIRHRLNAPHVEYSHQLHYLQMVTEKLAKGLLCEPGSRVAPPASHMGFVKFLRVAKQSAAIRDRLGYSSWPPFRAFVDSIMPLARSVEQLAPSSAGMNAPNPEYPWQEPHSGEVIAPADFAFVTFDAADPRMVKLNRLVDRLLKAGF